MREEVILVDKDDHETGVMEKMEAHEKGILHRAFSVFIFNSKNELLLQRRALNKYHSAGLWTNTCCSHPRPGEDSLQAAKRRLREEMGMETHLQFKTTFIYRSEFDNDLIEHELDHVFVGNSDASPIINPLEVESYNWLEVKEIKKRILGQPGEFTTWFKIAIEKLF